MRKKIELEKTLNNALKALVGLQLEEAKKLADEVLDAEFAKESDLQAKSWATLGLIAACRAEFWQAQYYFTNSGNMRENPDALLVAARLAQLAPSSDNYDVHGRTLALYDSAIALLSREKLSDKLKSLFSKSGTSDEERQKKLESAVEERRRFTAGST